MTRFAFALALLVPSLAAAEVTIKDKTGTIDCGKDPEAVIHTGGGTFTFTGACTKIAVNGGGNTITIASVKKLAIVGATNKIDVAAADKIAVTGSFNTVTYGATTTGKGKTTVASVGTNNKISKK